MSGATDDGEHMLLRDILAGIDQDVANAMLVAFKNTAFDWQADVKAVQWAVAMLQADVLAGTPIGVPQQIVAQQFADMVRLALPLAIHERHLRQQREAAQSADNPLKGIM